MHKLFSISVLFLSIVLFSCKKDEIIQTNNNSNNFEGSYFPLVEGNKWNFDGDLQYSNEVTGTLKRIEGEDFQEVLVKQTTASGYSYMRKDDEENISAYSQQSAQTGIITLKMKMLTDNPIVGDTWTEEIQSNAYTNVIYTFTILSKGNSRTVNGTTYDDVLAIQLDTDMELIGFDDFYDDDYYYRIEQQIGANIFPLCDLNDIKNKVKKLNKSQRVAGTIIPFASQVTYYAKNVGLIEQTGDFFGLNVYLKSSVLN